MLKKGGVMDKLSAYLLAVAAGFLGVSFFAQIMTAFCGKYNDRCGGSLQVWQLLSMAVIFLAPHVIAWYLTKET
jgi:hypothetical protein